MTRLPAALLTIALMATFAGFGIGATCTPLSQTQDQAILDAGCALISVFDPGTGLVVASVCESLVPIVEPIIHDLIQKAVKPADAADAGPPRFTTLMHGGKAVGIARADIAASVQAKLDEEKP